MPYEDHEKGCEAPQSSLQQLRFDPKPLGGGSLQSSVWLSLPGAPQGRAARPQGRPPAPRGDPAGPAARLSWISAQTEAPTFRWAAPSSRCGAAVRHPFASSPTI